MASSIRRFSMLGVLVLVGAVTISCATKGYVREQIAPVESRVSELESTTEEHAERIDAVDRRAQEGIGQARSAAQAADTRAGQAGESAATADRKAEGAQTSATQANTRVTTVENRLANLNNYTVAQTVAVRFPLNSAELSAEAMAALDQFAGQVRAGDFVELQGFTDSTGSDNYNLALSDRRATAVKRYLVTKNVPLFRMQIVGLGEANPAADNSTRDGRQQNRRVEARLLRAPTN